MNWKITASTVANLPSATSKMPFLLRGYFWLKTAILKLENALNRRAWFIRLTNKEYWNGQIFLLPTWFYFVYLAAKARSFMFFTAANSAIPTGGLVGENKADISRWIPPQYRPKNVVLEPTQNFLELKTALENAFLKFPLILKPTVGARGLMVRKVQSLAEIADHFYKYPTSFLVEEFIDYPVEAAVLYWKNPETNQSGILSVTVKEFLTVIGDGQTTVHDLLLANPRGVLQVPRLLREKPDMMRTIISNGEQLVVEPIGNHCRGTKFLNYNHLITSEMVANFDKIQADLPNCFVFRLDLKTPSVSDLQNGLNIKILEINGVGSDPAHIFDPNFPLFGMWNAYIQLWRKIYEVGTAVHRRGVAYMTWADFKGFVARQNEMVELQKRAV